MFWWAIGYFGGIDEVPHLWLNLMGCVVVMGIAMLLQLDLKGGSEVKSA